MTRAQRFQKDVDDIPAPVYENFRAAGPDIPDAERLAAYAAHSGLRRYDAAFDKVFAEVQATAVTDQPAVWLVYNMGVIVKTPRTTFAIDLAHRLGLRMAPLLDFALVTHNHIDHVDLAFLAAMDRAGKTVVSNFLCNYGAMRGGKMPGGYTRRKKVFKIGDVSIRTALSDHNGYLVDFTTTFEISVGDWTLYHTGDSSKLAKLNPKREPDLWIVHPRCGLDATEAAAKFHPRRTVVAHLCELSHPPDKWRWTIADGQTEAARLEAAGFEAMVPLWGERLQ